MPAPSPCRIRMSSLIFLVPIALLLGGAALGAFLWSLRSGQYDDLDGAAVRILIDEDESDAGNADANAEADDPTAEERSNPAGEHRRG